MNFFSYSFLYKFALAITFQVFIFKILTAQDSLIAENTYISWVKQFPNNKNTGRNSGFSRKIGNLIFGEKNSLSLSKPVSVLASGPESFMILDQANGVLFTIDGDKFEVPHSLKKKFKNFTSLVDICAKPDNEILFTDSRLNKIYVISSDRKQIKVLNDSLRLQQPTGIAYSSLTKEIFVSETNAHRICVLDEKGKLLRTIGKRGNADGEFNFPTFISIDRSGKLYVVDALNFRIQIFDSTGKHLLSFGKAGDATGYFARPKGIATDSFGNIYVADALFHVVQIFDSSGRYLNKIGKQGREKAEFWMPMGVFIDSNDYIYVADTYNSRVQIFKLNILNADEKNK